MNEQSSLVYGWILRDSSIEECLAEKFRMARMDGTSCALVLRNWVIANVQDAPYLQTDIGVLGSELETIVNWEDIVQKLEYRQNIFEQCAIAS